MGGAEGSSVKLHLCRCKRPMKPWISQEALKVIEAKHIALWNGKKSVHMWADVENM